MHKRFIYGEDLRPIGQTPILEMATRTTLGVLDLDYENTKLRRFGEGCEHMDHVEYRNRKGSVTGILLNQFVATDVREQLIEYGYPQSLDPIPPPEEFAWFERVFLLQHKIDPEVLEVTAEIEPEAPAPVQESQPSLVEVAASGLISGITVVTAIGSVILYKNSSNT